MSKKTSYQYLFELSKINSRSSFSRQEEPRTPRTDYIVEQLKLLNIEYQEDEFLINENSIEKYINIYVKFPALNPEITESILFVAHHDIANPNSQNCQDNTASVCNLLEFCSLLKGMELNKNIIICFTDGEEPASFNSGAGKIGRMHQEKQAPFENVLYAINLELTGKGKIIWADFDTYIRQFEDSKLIGVLQNKIENVFRVGTPFSDSYTLRHNKIDSVCIGCFTQEDVDFYTDHKYPPTWRLCHTMDDRFDRISEEDMSEFVNKTLINLLDID